MQIKPIAYTQTWPVRHKVMWPDQPFDFVKLEKDPEGIHYGLFVEEELIATISVFIDGEEAQFRKFATLQNQQGKGFGSKLLEFLLAELAVRGIKMVWCNARTDKQAYYRKFGFLPTGKHFTKGGKDFVIMEKREN